MPAPFAIGLCGYRKSNGKPNTSDASDDFSIELGTAMFDAMGVSRSSVAEESTGTALSQAVTDDLTARLEAQKSDLLVRPEQPLTAFDQFRHVGILAELLKEKPLSSSKEWKALKKFVESKLASPPSVARRLTHLIDAHEVAMSSNEVKRRRAFDTIGSESLLRLDVSVSRVCNEAHLLEAGFSSKWTLRTDRAQDCRSQGAKMAALRRGRMPHFATVTMEPRPYMLNILGGGSGEIDCVYHLDLPSLTQAIDATCLRKGATRERTRDTFKRLVVQRRIRDYQDLVDAVMRL